MMKSGLGADYNKATSSLFVQIGLRNLEVAVDAASLAVFT